MKNILIALTCATAFSASAQITTPQPSPSATVKQTVGLTEIEINYSRPSKKGRQIFGDLVPMGEIWRTGANKNTMITTDKILIFGKDTLQAGTYAIFTKPVKGGVWDVMFYTDTENWGTPENWDDAKVAVKTTANVQQMNDVTESFTIGFEELTSKGANLTLTWDKTKAVISFGVATEEQVTAAITKVMAGPSARDYYLAADYYLSEGKDMNQALAWINKSIEMEGEAKFWVLRRKALIQAELNDYKGAIATAKESRAGAEAAGYDNYVKMNDESIEEWTQKQGKGK